MKFQDADFTDVVAAIVAAGLGTSFLAGAAGTIAARAYEVADALDKERVERAAKRNRAAPDAPVVEIEHDDLPGRL